MFSDQVSVLLFIVKLTNNKVKSGESMNLILNGLFNK